MTVPATIEDAREELSRLFRGLQPDTVGGFQAVGGRADFDYAFAMLEKFPELANEKFDFGGRTPLAPICYFICISYEEKHAYIYEVYDMFPEAMVVQEDSDCFSPLMLACLHAQKKMILLFANNHPEALAYHWTDSDGRTWFPLQCILRRTEMDSKDQLEVVKAFVALRPACVTLCDKMSRSPMELAWRYGCDNSILKFLADIFPSECESMRIAGYTTTLTMDHEKSSHVRKILPQLECIEFGADVTWEIDGFLQTIRRLNLSGKIKKLELPLPSFFWDRPVAQEMLRKLFNECETLSYVVLSGRPGLQFDFDDGDAILQFLEGVRFANPSLDLYLCGFRYTDPTGLSSLLSSAHAPRFLGLQNSVVDIDHWVNIASTSKQVLHTVILSNCRFTREETFRGFLDQVAQIKYLPFLTIAGETGSADWTMKGRLLVPPRLLAMVRQKRVLSLRLRTNDFDLDFEFLRDLVEGRMRTLYYKCNDTISDEQLEELAQLMERNTTLGTIVLTSEGRKYEDNPAYKKIQYFAELNLLGGRSRIRRLSYSKSELAARLEYLGERPSSMPLTQISTESIVYGMLLERPSLWSVGH